MTAIHDGPMTVLGGYVGGRGHRSAIHPQIVEERRGGVSVRRERQNIRAAADRDAGAGEAFARTFRVDGGEKIAEFIRDGELVNTARAGEALVGGRGKNFWIRHGDWVRPRCKGVARYTGGWGDRGGGLPSGEVCSRVRGSGLDRVLKGVHVGAGGATPDCTDA